MIKGMIFDLDGTVMNSIADIADSANLTMEEFGFPGYTIEQYKMMVGNGFAKLIERALPPAERTPERIDEVLGVFYGYYSEHYKNKTAPYSGIHKLLEDLQNAGILIAVNSNKRQDYTEALVSAGFPGIVFTDVIGGGAGYPDKPDPSGALAAAAHMGLTPKEICYVGDSCTDVQTGKNAGMTVIGVTWGFRSEEELVQSGADIIVHAPEDIAEYLGL